MDLIKASNQDSQQTSAESVQENSDKEDCVGSSPEKEKTLEICQQIEEKHEECPEDDG